MTTYRNAALTSTDVRPIDFAIIVGQHGDVDPALLTSVCLSCQSITVSPDTETKAVMQAAFDLTCCNNSEMTILP